MLRLFRLSLAALFAITLGATSVRAAEPDKLLPADTDTVIFVNFKQLIGSDVVKKYALEQLKQVLDGQEAKQLLQDMGLDPLKDIETLWGGTSGGTKETLKGLVIVHGNFDPDKLFKAAEAASKMEDSKFSLIKDGDVTMFKFQPEQGNPVYGTVANKTTVLAGTDKKIVADAFQQASEDKTSKIDAQLTGMVKKMDEKTSVFAVSLLKDKFKDVVLPDQLPIDLSSLEKVLPKAETLTIAVKVGANIDLQVIFGMKDEDSAADMSDAIVKIIDGIKGLIPLLAAAEPRAAPLVDVMKTVTSDVKNKNVTIAGKLTGENLGKLINPPE